VILECLDQSYRFAREFN
jgi:hypothetical protein